MSKRALAAIVAGVLIGGGVTAVSPAGAEVSQAAATNWKKIWKKKLQPLADKRYYTKSASDAKYSTKTETSAAFANYYTKAQTDAAYALKGQSYTKAESDGKYATAGSSYTKTESDARYSRSTGLVRGSYMILFSATAANQAGGTDISFGPTFASAPVVHLIPPGGVVPEGCSGTAAAPDASPGHLCVFGSLIDNGTALNSCKVSTSTCFGTASDPWGASIFTRSVAAGLVQMFGTWAARPTGVVTTAPGIAKSAGDSINEVGPSAGVR